MTMRRLRVHRELLDDGEVVVDAAELVGHAHAHAVLDERRAAFRVERDEVERRAGLAGRVVRARRRVLQERAQHRLRAARHFRAADLRRRQRAAHAFDREVVELVELVAPRLRFLRRLRIAAAAPGPTEPLQ